MATMASISKLFRIGRGPSSSHTMGPGRAAERVLRENPDADRFEAVLQGSLAKTGKGHRTDYAIEQAFLPKPVTVVFDKETTQLIHPNTMIFRVYRGDEMTREYTVFSVGGGSIRFMGEDAAGGDRPVYEHTTFTEIREYCEANGLNLYSYCAPREHAAYGTEIDVHLTNVWNQMQKTVQAGLEQDGILPGGLRVVRRAMDLYKKGIEATDGAVREKLLLSAYAFAAAEENASGEFMVTAPTCGASGVLPAVLYYEKTENRISDETIKEALAAAGLIGNIIKTNGSVSGAECGCQAEIGSACCMAAAAISYLRGYDFEQIETAAEIAMEHNLGLTCDPVEGLVQIPCIERNAFGALRAYEAAELAKIIYVGQKVSFDTVIKTMKETGKDLSSHYRETAEGGLAKMYVKDFY